MIKSVILSFFVLFQQCFGRHWYAVNFDNVTKDLKLGEKYMQRPFLKHLFWTNQNLACLYVNCSHVTLLTRSRSLVGRSPPFSLLFRCVLRVRRLCNERMIRGIALTILLSLNILQVSSKSYSSCFYFRANKLTTSPWKNERQHESGSFFCFFFLSNVHVYVRTNQKQILQLISYLTLRKSSTSSLGQK